MKIALAQLNFQIGAFGANSSKIIEAIQSARSKGAELIIFPELSITGYPPRDFLEIDSFIRQCKSSLDEIARHCLGIDAIIGAPGINTNKEGKKLFNSAYFISDGKIKQVVNKTLLPDYDIFDEFRYFEPNKDFNLIVSYGIKIAVTICEDIWNIHTPYYSITPLDELEKLHPDLIINIAASPFSCSHDQERLAVLKKNALRYQLPIIYVNHVGAQTEILYDGVSKIVNKNGDLVCQLSLFHEEIQIVELESIIQPENKIDFLPVNKISLIHDALVMGIRDYFFKLGFTKAILGLSGGIDSAVVMVLLAKALGPENVKALLLPSMYSSSHSIEDAVELCIRTKVPYEIISIKTAVSAFEKTLDSYFEELPADITEENLQARVRAVLLMAFSNKFGYILINTSNKSEMAVGYGTLYGDMCGGISVLGDVYKTEVFELARFMNKEVELIPENIIRKPPSAELKPDQKDSDSLPDYCILDQILFQYIELQKGADDIIAEGFDPILVNRILKLVNSSEHKRYQSPPVLRVSDKAFGIGRRMPIVAKYS